MLAAWRKPCCSPEKSRYPTGVPLRAQRVHHHLGLVRRHDHVFVALEEDDGRGQALDMRDRRALLVRRSDQRVHIARLELVRVARQHGDVADSVVARAAAKTVAERQGGERGVASGAAAGDDAPRGVGEAALGEEARAVHAIVDIHDAPVAIQQLPIGAAVPGAAAVVDVEDRDAAAGPDTGSAGRARSMRRRSVRHGT